jgi:hypothetical protein
MSDSGPFSSMKQDLPSVRDFIENLTEDIRNRRSVLVLIPSTLNPADVWAMLRSHIAPLEFRAAEMDCSELPAEQPLIERVCSALEIQWNDGLNPTSIDHFMRNARDLPDVLFFEGYDALSAERQLELLNFFTEWTDSSHVRVDQGDKSMALCIISGSPATAACAPSTDTHLAVHWWWGMPTGLEMRLICRILNKGRDELSCLWIESILPAIAGSDMTLADHLWDDYDLTIDGLWRRLHSYSDLRHWEKPAVKDLGIEDHEEILNFRSDKTAFYNSAAMKQLWVRGLLYWTPEYGLQLNTAVLALLGREKEIRHRIWRGQVEYLLPILDRIRLAVCEKLTGLYGPDWPHKWEKPKYEEDYEAVKKDPMACELGYLYHLLKTCGKMKRDRNLLPLVNQARAVRNELAHYRPVEYMQYERLIRETAIVSDGQL